ncbi:uncharacterized protein LOC116931615 [Daphnia magna]|uniref:uncharacterized protein LOC116931615 n=1 Tax=Daphnia magna TaxID=35525 RepID=UPI001E1BBB09|nr:uncharacterized protein LOC116931615 [Daphnia magna]
MRHLGNLITDRGSRGSISSVMKHLETLLATAAQVLTNLSMVEDQAENDRQDELHLKYIELAGDALERGQQNLNSRLGEPLSETAGNLAPSIPASEQNRQEEERKLAQQRADAAALQADEARRQANEASNRAEEARREAAAVTHVSQRLSQLGQDWRQNQRRLNSSTAQAAPDEWIDHYAAGQLKPNVTANLYRALVHDTGKSAGEKLAILKRHLKGDCLDLVQGLGGGEPAYIEALVRLKQSCGRRDVMRAATLQVIEKVELKNDPATFKRFAERIRTHLFDLSRIGEYNAPDLIEKICMRLQPPDRLEWNRGRRGGLETRSLNAFGSWLCERAAEYQNAYSIAYEQTSSSALKPHHWPHARSHPASSAKATDNYSAPKVTFRPFCFKCEGYHKLENCSRFKALVVADRVSFCTKHMVCFGCLGSQHSVRNCATKKPCKIAGCSLHHHELVHDPDRPVTVFTPDATRTGATRTATAHLRKQNPQQIAMGMMRLKVCGADKGTVWANVFIDEGSDSTLMRQGFASANRITGVHQILTVEGAGGVVKSYRSQRVNFQIDTDYGEELNLSCSTLPTTVVSTTPVTDWGVLKKRWSHLADIPVGETGGRVDILIGNDYSHLIVALESRVGNDYEPTAIRSRLGWIIRGVVSDGASVTAVRTHNVTSSSQLEEIALQLRRFCDTENFGTESKTKGMSDDDRQAIAILEAGTKKLELGYEVPITWKRGEPALVCNRQVTQQRLGGLLRRFSREPAFEKDYRAAVQKTIDKGYASVLSEEEAASAKYFLAHHGVYKGPKLRDVFDAAAPYQGKCFNNAILSGPALHPSLPSVLIQFREEAVAWASDVEAMFSRFRLNPSDANYFWFLWQESSLKT